MKRIDWYRLAIGLFALMGAAARAEELDLAAVSQLLESSSPSTSALGSGVDSCISGCKTSECFAGCAVSAAGGRNPSDTSSPDAAKAELDAALANGEKVQATMDTENDPFKVRDATKRIEEAKQNYDKAVAAAENSKDREIERVINGLRDEDKEKKRSEEQQFLQLLMMEGSGNPAQDPGFAAE